MKLAIFFSKGKGFITREGLRCAAPRESDPARLCNKLLVVKNDRDQIAGSFQCERCGQKIEVRMEPQVKRCRVPLPSSLEEKQMHSPFQRSAAAL